jgi:Na+-driven multidrug efflux pump
MSNAALSGLFGGVSSLASYKMGEKKTKEAESDFTCILLFVFVLGAVKAIIERIFIRPMLMLLGASEIIYPYAEAFQKIGALYTPLVLVSNTFVRFYIPAGKPKMELFSSIVNVSCNLFFDWYFVVHKGIGMTGAAYANLIANIVMIVIALSFFTSRHSELRLGRPQSRLLPLLRDSMKYGISSFLANTSVAASTAVSNYVLLHWGNEASLAAFTIVNNIQSVFMSCYFGLLGTTGPIVSYAMGERNREKLKLTFQQIFFLLLGLTAIAIISFLGMGYVLAELYVGGNVSELKDMIYYGMKIAPFSFLFFGFNIAVRMTLASLGNHRVSAILTFLHEVLLSNLIIISLPALFGINGVWYSFLLTNILMFFITAYTVYVNRDNYGYGRSGNAYLLD